jgi:hydroxymethylglutaryl-CoA synthase
MSNLVKYAIAGGADTAQGAPGDPLEYAAASGGASVIVAKKTSDTVAFFEGTFSFTTDTPDFWRRELKPYPAHGGRFTGEPSYFRHVISCTAELMERLDLKPTDIDYVVFHQPNGKFPLKAGNILGFPPEKIKPGLLVTKIGNTYSGSSMISLCAILDIAKPGDRILVTSYGSGAGSDSFSIVVQDAITEKVGLAPKVEDYVKSKKYISYAEYVKYRKKIVTG